MRIGNSILILKKAYARQTDGDPILKLTLDKVESRECKQTVAV